jgi:antitoxin component of RelBE/YafQ-DinJ toxin-antitoxin module
MSDFILTIPDDVVRMAQRIADEKSLPVERVLLDHLKTLPTQPTLPPDEETELAALHQLSDDTLWTIARERLPANVRARMEVLMEKISRRTVTPEEFEEQSGYVQRADRVMLRKATAAALLTERGYTVRPQDMDGS